MRSVLTWPQCGHVNVESRIAAVISLLRPGLKGTLSIVTDVAAMRWSA